MKALTLLTHPDPELLQSVAAKHGVDDLPERVTNGNMAVLSINDTDALLFVSAGKTKDTDAKAFWIEGVAGKCFSNAKRNLRLIHDVLSDCEVLASITGASEIRIEASTRNRLKLNLFQTFGFVPLRVGQDTVMRKGLSHGT